MLLILEDPGSVGVQKLKIPFPCMLSEQEEGRDKLENAVRDGDLGGESSCQPVNVPCDAHLNSFHNAAHADSGITTPMPVHGTVPRGGRSESPEREKGSSDSMQRYMTSGNCPQEAVLSCGVKRRLWRKPLNSACRQLLFVAPQELL